MSKCHDTIALFRALHAVAMNPALCRGGVSGFARATGRKVSTLAHKFNPHDTPTLNLPELLDFLAYVTPEGRRVVLDALHGTLGDSFAVFVDTGKPPALLSSLAELLRGAADLAALAGMPVRRIGRRPPEATPHAMAARLIRAALDVFRAVCGGHPLLPADVRGGLLHG
ncbi:phage regulatory CII family protein [Pseudomonas nitroreducens]|uniref:phage regulatory CII family protein n=1 Tax=Pseudomonas nitroreducens TaxID=46680 RepID=UPI00037C422B|nr:phage regulatory CII family protein [Pseudomonas nitroreducens]